MAVFYCFHALHGCGTALHIQQRNESLLYQIMEKPSVGAERRSMRCAIVSGAVLGALVVFERGGHDGLWTMRRPGILCGIACAIFGGHKKYKAGKI